MARGKKSAVTLGYFCRQPLAIDEGSSCAPPGEQKIAQVDADLKKCPQIKAEEEEEMCGGKNAGVISALKVVERSRKKLKLEFCYSSGQGKNAL